MAISEIVFFDLETTYPSKTGQKFFVLEFGAVVVCLKTLAELESYCTLIRPHDLSVVPVKSSRSHGINREEIANAPSFDEVADKIFKVLDGRIWAGHNIQRFDCARIKEVFAQNNRPGPTPAGLIDSLGVLTQKFGRRAGNMKMATLADYFGLGQQKHRSLEDVRMNLEVLKHCATVLFLESSMPPNIVNGLLHNGPTVTTRSRGLIKSNNLGSRKSPPASTSHQRPVPYARESLGKMTDRVKNIFSYAKTQPLNNFLKHSKSIIR